LLIIQDFVFVDNAVYYLINNDILGRKNSYPVTRKTLRKSER